MALFKWQIIALCVILSVSFIVKSSAQRAPKRYIVNLDDPEEIRWKQVVLDHKEIVALVQQVLKSMIPKDLIPLVTLIADDLDQYLGSPYANEIKGIADVLGTSVGDVVLANLIYDATAYCTSIVSQDAAGQIWHSRNLDYGFGNILENITVFVDFQSSGKNVYSAVMYAGYVGVLSGQKPYQFTVTVDERDQGSPLYNLIVGLLDRKVVPVSFLVRNVMMSSSNYTEAIKTLSFTPTAAPVYFIIAGVKPGDAAVISKGRLAYDDIWTIDPEHGRWFEVETNYDHWTTPPPSDNRRDPAIKQMIALGQKNISVTSLKAVMSTEPVKNKKTTYTVVMSALIPELIQAWIW